MTDPNNEIHLPEEFVAEDLNLMEEPNEAEDPKKKPEVEPEQLPKEDPGQPGEEPGEDDDDDDDDPFTETEIGDDPDEIEKKTTIFEGR